ncbi:TonB-dependent siderophore receptor, partial [Rhizobium leguminosarum]
DYQKVKQQQIGYQFEHEFDNGMTFRQNLRYSHLDLEARYLGVTGWSWTVAHRGTNAIRDAIGRIGDIEVERRIGGSGAIAKAR